MKLNPLVHNVIWPAVAGSVLWTFLQVAVDPNIFGPSRLPRLAALLCVGVYLATDWVNTHEAKNIKDNYWCADMPLAASFATFAVATQFGTWWAAWPLAAAFTVAIIGHCKGAWDSKDKSSSCKERATLAGLNAGGLLVLLTGTCANARYAVWWTPSAIFSVVFLYLLLRKWISTL